MTHEQIDWCVGLRVDHGVSLKKGTEVWWIRDRLHDAYCEASAKYGDLSGRCQLAAKAITVRNKRFPRMADAIRDKALLARFFDSEDAAWAAIEELL
jgi:hypothetical protein